MKRPYLPGLIVTALGSILAVAPMVAPRNWFGEYGHGDGMGLIGLMMMGGILALIGVAILVTGLIFGASTRRNNQTEMKGRE